MGFFFSNLWKNDNEIIMLGLDSSGKTSILNYLKEQLGENSPIRYNSRDNLCFTYKGLNIIVVDLGGYDNYFNERKMKEYFGKAKGFIFVVDSGDKYRFKEELFREFENIFSKDRFKTQPILILANKQDLNGALNIEDIIKKIEIEKNKNRDWLAVGTSVITGEGIDVGFDWLISILNKKYNSK